MSRPAADNLSADLHSGDLARIERALRAGAGVDGRNSRGETALLQAVRRNDLAAARLLIAAGADVNAKDQISDSPYLLAGAEGRVDILRLILAHGADLRATNRFGGTALIPAAEKGHPEAVALLIAAGVDVNHVNDLGWTALMKTVVLSDGGPLHQGILRQLLAAGADKSIPDRQGITALRHARQRGYREMVALLQ